MLSNPLRQGYCEELSRLAPQIGIELTTREVYARSDASVTGQVLDVINRVDRVNILRWDGTGLRRFAKRLEAAELDASLRRFKIGTQPAPGRRAIQDMMISMLLTMMKISIILAAFALPAAAQDVAAKDVARGRALAKSEGCAGCHSIPGVSEGANVGPSLSTIGRRVYIAGLLPNTPDNMARWLTETQKFRPGDAMPSTSLGVKQAADLAAFLATLR